MRACIGLSVKAAIQWMFVFVPAIETEIKVPHRGPGPIIGKRLDDAEPRAALRAIREWIVPTSPSWIDHVLKAARAWGQVGHNCRGRRRLRVLRNILMTNPEFPLPRAANGLWSERGELGGWWEFAGQSRKKSLQRSYFPFYLQRHALLVISNPTG